MNKITEALKRVEESLSMYDQTGNAVFWDEALAAIREALGENNGKRNVDGCSEHSTFSVDGSGSVSTSSLAEPLCEDEGCPNRGTPHICIEKPVKQDPVAILDHERGGSGAIFWLVSPTMLLKDTQLYAAPVDAKAIRAEALEEAAKRFEDEEHPLQPKKVAAAIRGLK